MANSVQSENYESFVIKYQRDVNRISDNDRNTRKKGLEKVLGDLPWNKSSQRAHIEKFSKEILFPLISSHISDSVEKCRELSLAITSKILGISPLLPELGTGSITILCSRLSDIPFPEPAEELRFKILALLSELLQNDVLNDAISTLSFNLLLAVSKSLLDNFPAAKKAAADILLILHAKIPISIRLHFKTLLKGLLINCTHQHSKVRIPTLKVYKYIYL